MTGFRSSEWNESYKRGENYIFYPKEEVVKFLNRFVRKKVNLREYKDLIKLPKNPRGLDLGCGIGVQSVLLSEFGFNTVGVDISDMAIKKAEEIKSFKNISNLEFKVLNKISLDFPKNYFDIAISDSVLDSMEFSFAREYMIQLDKVVSKIVYLNIISNESNETKLAEDVIVKTSHELNTIQSYYDYNRILELISDTDFKIIYLNKSYKKNIESDIIDDIRYNIVLSKLD